jgi:putative ABC transport system permease protein
VVATAFAASRPARAVARVPVVTALSGRPAPPKKVHRSAVPGLVFLAAAFLLLGYSGGTAQGNGSRGMSELVLGLVALVPGVILLAPFFLSVVARLARHTPVAARLALRDLARYRARTGSGLAAISLGVMIAVIIATVAQVRYGNVLDYAGPNLSPNQLIVYSSAYQAPPDAPALTADQLQSQSQTARAIGGAVGAHHVLELDAVIVDIHTAPRRSASNPGAGRQWSGPIYLATPQLLRAFGITGSQADPRADVLSSRPGLSGVAALSLSWCNATSQPKQISPNLFQAQCLSGGSLAHPVIDEVGALPTGTSAPNSVMTEHAVHTLGISTSVTGWLVETARPLTAAQIADARQAASTKGMTVEAKNDAPTSAQVIDWATAFGMALALCILAMSVGLLRSETAGDLRTLAATGASGTSRRTVTAATAGAMGLLGAVLGTLCGYVGVIGYLRGNSLNGGIGALGNVPVANLLLILLGMPALAAVVGWLLAGREPSAMAHQPIE